MTGCSCRRNAIPTGRNATPTICHPPLFGHGSASSIPSRSDPGRRRRRLEAMEKRLYARREVGVTPELAVGAVLGEGARGQLIEDHQE